MRNVLVFAAGCYPAIEIYYCLRDNLIFHPIGASSYSNHSEYVFQEYYNSLPYINDPDFITKFVAFLKEKNIEFVIPTDDDIAVILTEHEDVIPAKIVCSPKETAKLCRYKSQTYEALKECDYVPKTYKTEDINYIKDYPVFVKPDSGQGSQGARIINNRSELEYVHNIENPVICEFLPGDEYTVDCFTDRFGKLLFCNPRKRSRIMYGITARGFNVPCTEEFRSLICDINSKIKFRGYWFAQLKRDADGKLKLMELCTRFAGSFNVSKGLGINLPLMALCDAAEMQTEALTNDYTVELDKIFIDRYKLGVNYQTVYIDYDDTITSDRGKTVNAFVGAYLYQCHNKGINVILLTRHSEDHDSNIHVDMKRLGISEELFSQIIELKWDEEKSDYITDENSIFIDNSFAERKKVHDRLGISVFDVSNIDCLFDWR